MNENGGHKLCGDAAIIGCAGSSGILCDVISGQQRTDKAISHCAVNSRANAEEVARRLQELKW